MTRIAALFSVLVVPVASLVSGRASVPSIEDCYAANQKTRNAITMWITPEAIKASIYGYGMTNDPLHFAPRVALDVGRHPIQHDFISQLGARMQMKGQQVKYLEIGVSVLKGVHTQANFFKDAQITAVDIEDPNPTIENRWANKSVLDNWTDSDCEINGNDDMRRLHNRRTDYVNKYDGPQGTGNTLFYLAGDAFNKFTYQHLAKNIGVQNLILSDGMHTKEAIHHELENLLYYGIIAPSDGEFAMVWDDCNDNGGMRGTFLNDLVPKLRKHFHSRPVCHGFFQIHGWLGKNEYPHSTCIFTTLDLRGPYMGTAGNWKPRSGAIQCPGFVGRLNQDGRH